MIEYDVKICENKRCDIYGDDSIFSPRHKYCPFCGKKTKAIQVTKNEN